MRWFGRAGERLWIYGKQKKIEIDIKGWGEME